jgi:putative glycosyltransferase (TIGR04372 family)
MRNNILFKIVKYSLFVFPLLLIYFFRPFRIIRFQRLSTEVIGAFAEHVETYLCKKKDLSPKDNRYIDLFCYGKISNIQLAKMIKKKINVLPSYLLEPIIVINSFISRYIQALSIHEINTKSYRDVNDLYSKYSPNLDFTKKELDLGNSILKEMGLKKDSKFICLVIRDSHYKKKTNLIERDMSYHDFRDFDSDNFIQAAEKIAQKGFYVIRMGKFTEKKFLSKNEKIIDYSNSEFRSDFMDIFLGAHCEFCVTTATGIDTIPLIFKKPIAAIVVPLGYIQNYNDRFINITKHHYLNGRKLNAKEIFENKLGFLLDKKFFDQKKIVLKEPSPEEISEFVLEAFQRFVEKKTDYDEDLQVKFRLKFKEYLNYAEKNDEKYQDNLKLGQFLQPNKIKGFFGSDYLVKNSFLG